MSSKDSYSTSEVVHVATNKFSETIRFTIYFFWSYLESLALVFFILAIVLVAFGGFAQAAAILAIGFFIATILSWKLLLFIGLPAALILNCLGIKHRALWALTGLITGHIAYYFFLHPALSGGEGVSLFAAAPSIIGALTGLFLHKQKFKV